MGFPSAGRGGPFAPAPRVNGSAAKTLGASLARFLRSCVLPQPRSVNTPQQPFRNGWRLPRHHCWSREQPLPIHPIH